MATHLPSHPADPLTIGVLLYPGFTLLDLAGPQMALGFHGRTHLVWKALEPVVSDTGVSVNPTATYQTCPGSLDVLFVGGAVNNHWLMQDEETLAFLRKAGATARYVTSVCTGSLLLGAAGLLDGYRSACHWAYTDILRDLGVEVSDDRVVRDRNRFSGGGVTAGIDFGLRLLAELRGEAVAKVVQLGIQYSPEPPFDAGLPHLAGPETTAAMSSLVAGIVEDGRRIAREVRRGRLAEAA